MHLPAFRRAGLTNPRPTSWPQYCATSSRRGGRRPEILESRPSRGVIHFVVVLFALLFCLLFNSLIFFPPPVFPSFSRISRSVFVHTSYISSSLATLPALSSRYRSRPSSDNQHLCCSDHRALDATMKPTALLTAAWIWSRMVAAAVIQQREDIQPRVVSFDVSRSSHLSALDRHRMRKRGTVTATLDNQVCEYLCLVASDTH